MRNGLSHIVRSGIGVLTAAVLLAVPSAAQNTPLAIGTGRLTIAGSSNIHDYTASTTAIRVARVQLGSLPAGADLFENALKPGGLEAFEVTIPVKSLASQKDGLDKNMHSALKAAEHPEITFKLLRFENRPAPATGLRAIGVLRVAGVDRQVTIDIATERKDASLVVKGTLALLMTDWGVVPPKAMMGMLKTDPKVTVTFEVVVAANLT